MISPCHCSARAEEALCALVGAEASAKLGAVEVEFREVPYFVVSRTRNTWSSDQGDINAINILNVTDRGIVVDPLSQPTKQACNTAHRLTFIPWSNVLSITVTRAGDGAEGSARA